MQIPRRRHQPALRLQGKATPLSQQLPTVQINLTSHQPSPPQESQTNVIELKHDQHIVTALLEYLYRFDYAIPADLSAAPAASNAEQDTGTDTNRKEQRPGPGPPLLFHARLHAAARFYGVPALADLALARFVVGAAELWRTPATLAELVKVLYGRSGAACDVVATSVCPSTGRDKELSHPNGDSTVCVMSSAEGGDGVSALRAAAVDIAVKHFAELAGSQAWRDTMDEVGLFGRELCEAVVEAGRRRKVAGGYTCGTCGRVVWMCLPGREGEEDGYVHCVLCGHMWLRSAWAERRVGE